MATERLSDDLDLGEIDRLQTELLALVDEMTAEPDGDRKQALVKRIADQSALLKARCEDLEQRARAKAVDQRGTFDVQLTPDQRVVVKDRTGVELERFPVEDNGGGLIRVMPYMTRDQILELALRHADAIRRDEEARRTAAIELARITEELRRDAPEQIRAEIERLLADPQFRAAFEPKKARP